MNGDDVRVIERRGGLRLLHEPAAAILVRDAVGGQYLDRDFAAEPWIARAIHLAHPARADQPEDFVGAEPLTGLEAQGKVLLQRRSIRRGAKTRGPGGPD